MSASLVGSEMCIRDRVADLAETSGPRPRAARRASGTRARCCAPPLSFPCLLYTSDAADDM
eukprot:8631568-Alexandrium_andersonii.AAC.1